MLVVISVAPVVRRCPDDARNRALERNAALAHAQVQLAQHVGDPEVVQDVTVNDTVASVAAPTALRPVCRDRFVILERNPEPDDRYEVTVGCRNARAVEVVAASIR